MKSITIHNLPTNSYIDMPVFLDDSYILLTSDVPVTDELKQRLSEWGYTSVLTDGSPIDSPPEPNGGGVSGEGSSSPPGTAVLDSNIKDQEKRKASLDFFLSYCDFLKGVFSMYLENNVFSMNTISDKVKEMIIFVKENRKYILRINDLVTDEYDQIVTQSIKTTIVSLVLSDVLKLPVFKQIEIGMTGLLHDIGMIRIPPEIYMKKDALTPEERKAIITHTVLGFRILKAAEFPMSVSRAVLEHQEKENGSGYPRGLTGDKISFYAKLIAIASSYVATVSNRPYRDAMDGHAGIMDLLKNSGKQYDEQIIRVLVYTLSIYPIGTFVILSNGTRGIVIETNPKNPRYPVVKLLMSEEGLPYKEQPVLNTREGEGGIHILRPLMNNEIKVLQKNLNK